MRGRKGVKIAALCHSKEKRYFDSLAYYQERNVKDGHLPKSGI